MMTNSQKKNNNHFTTVPEPEEPDPESDDPVPSRGHETPAEPDEDDDDDYGQLKAEYLELHEEIKSKAVSERRRLPKLKNGKNLKRIVNNLG